MVTLNKTLLSKCNKDNEAELRESFAHAHLFREKMVEVLEDKLKSAHNRQISDSAYDSAGWPYKQADLSGYQRAIEEIKKFF